MEQMQQIAEGLKESAQNNKKRNKSQEHGGGVDPDDRYIKEDMNSSQGSLEVMAEDLSDVEQRVEEFIDFVPETFPYKNLQRMIEAEFSPMYKKFGKILDQHSPIHDRK